MSKRVETLYHRELPFRLLGQVVPPVVCERDDAVALPAERHGRVQHIPIQGDPDLVIAYVAASWWRGITSGAAATSDSNGTRTS